MGSWKNAALKYNKMVSISLVSKSVQKQIISSLDKENTDSWAYMVKNKNARLLTDWKSQITKEDFFMD